jgi:uracil-DNA glycosylase
MNVKLEDSWKNQLAAEFEKEYFIALTDFLKEEYKTQQIYPPGKLIFNAFDTTPFNEVKVVILGQDPYHGPGQAHGLSFSVPDGVRFPPSLENVLKEVQSCTAGVEIPTTGNLTRWAEQGVLLLNSILTVRARQAASHQKKGWEQFTDAVIQVLNEQREGIVFMLWGKYAQQKGAFIDRDKHLVLESAHPSPFAAHKGFFGNRHFEKANQYLEEHGQKAIIW